MRMHTNRSACKNSELYGSVDCTNVSLWFCFFKMMEDVTIGESWVKGTQDFFVLFL